MRFREVDVWRVSESESGILGLAMVSVENWSRTVVDMWGVDYMLVILKFLCTDVFVGVKLMFSLLELLLFLREGRVRCRSS